MSVIENFAALSQEEINQFAEEFVKTLNEKSTFSSTVNYKFLDAEADELGGGLYLNVETVEPIEITRKATWTQGSIDELEIGRAHV